MQYEILLIEDHPADVALVKKAFARLQAPINLATCLDGVDAMLYLHMQGRYANVTRPHLVLLDLNMPRKDGRAVLREVKADQALRGIPIIILTTSAAPSDVHLAYDLHASGYLTKPASFDDFVRVLDAFCGFWLRAAHLP